MLLEKEIIEINQQDECYGWTALMWASRKGQKEIVEILLQNKKINIS